MSSISILNHSSSSVCQNGQRRMCKGAFRGRLVHDIDILVARVCGCECERGTVWVGVCARVDLYSVFVKFCEWLRGCGRQTRKHAVPESNARGHYMHKDVCIQCVWGARTVHTVWLCARLCLNVRVCVTTSVHNIFSHNPVTVLLYLW